MPTTSCCDRLTIRVVLLKVSPLVAQLISVPDDLSLEELHDVLQLVLGWSGKAFSSVFMKVEIRSPYLSVVFIANHLPVLLFQRSAKPFDYFLALAVSPQAYRFPG